MFTKLCFLLPFWQFLLRNNFNLLFFPAFFLPLSGGADSSSTAILGLLFDFYLILVYCMAKLVYDEIVENKSEEILEELRLIV